MACSIALLAPLRHVAAQEGRPAAPDSAPPSREVAPTPATRPHGGLPSPHLISDARYVVLVATGLTAMALDTVRRRDIAPQCAERFSADALPPGADSESVGLGGQFLVVVVTGAHKGEIACQIQWNLSPVSIWRAATMPAQGSSAPAVPVAARLRVDGSSVPAAMALSRPSYERTESGWRRAGNQLRYYYDMSVIRPRPDGLPHEIVVQVWDRGPIPAQFDLDPAAAEALALQYVGWKLSMTLPSAAAPQLAIAPSRRVLPALELILDSSRTDLIAAGIHAAAWGSSRRERSERSDVVARLISAEALLAQGDPALAEALIASVIREHPCLVPPPGSSTRLAELVAPNRRASRCRPVSPMRAASLSLVPGLGNLAVNERRTATLGAGLVAVAFVRALLLNSEANQRYAEYQASRNPTELAVIYESVRDLRGQRASAIKIGVGLWALDALSAVRGAMARERRIADDHF
jgi:hypothetical protein